MTLLAAVRELARNAVEVILKVGLTYRRRSGIQGQDPRIDRAGFRDGQEAYVDGQTQARTSPGRRVNGRRATGIRGREL